MKIEQFEMERTQSLYEHAVDYNLAESGVSPLSVNDLVSAETLAELAAMPLCYPEGMGSELLRERIALFYDNATADNIVVTNGGSEANYIALQALLEPGDRVACMIPNYLQTWGLARAYSERTDAFHLVESRGGDSARWALDLDSLAAAVSPATGMITVTNPNNPSGAVLDEAELEALVEAARRADAWLVFDEIYRGTEHLGPVRQGDRHLGVVEGVRHAGAAYRLDGGPGARHPANDALPRLHHSHPQLACRSPGAHRHGAHQARRDSRPQQVDRAVAASASGGMGG